MFAKTEKYKLLNQENDEDLQLELKERNLIKKTKKSKKSRKEVDSDSFDSDEDQSDDVVFDENEYDLNELFKKRALLTGSNPESSESNYLNGPRPRRLAKIRNRCSRIRSSCFVIFLFTALAITTLFIFGYDRYFLSSVWNPYLSNIFKFGYDFEIESSKDWSINIDAHGTESCVRLFDIDDDGLDDAIFGFAGVSELNSAGGNDGIDEEQKYKNAACGQNETSVACQGLVMGIRGYDGKILYKFSTKSEVFEFNCHYIDVNKDGKIDCVAAGRKRTLLAFDPRDGKIFWDASFGKELNDNWNIYNPIVLPHDFDNDGVLDIIISHGGNPAIPPEEHNREPGRINMYSGRIGKQIGKSLPIPDNKETYMSPILHTQNDGSSYLLIGSGGETVPGDLMIISLTDFYEFIMKDSSSFKRPAFNGSYSAKEILSKQFHSFEHPNSLYSLYKSISKGIMVPPVLVDINKDGVNDILVLSFDGAVILFDGLTFKKIWEKYYECHETYTTPAPGYFNDDDVPDFILIQNLGTFDYYKNSTVLILNGIDGSVLWSMVTPRMAMVSPLTIKAKDDSKSTKRDIYFFRVQGIEYLNTNKLLHQVFHGIEPQQPMDKNPSNSKTSVEKRAESKSRQDSSSIENQFDKCNRQLNINQQNNDDDDDQNNKINKPKCENKQFNELYLTTFGLVVDRTIQESPIVVFRSEPTYNLYNFTSQELKSMQNDLNNNNNNEANKKRNVSLKLEKSNCVVMESMERNTGAVGYLTNKNDLDILTVVTRGGVVRDYKGEYVKILTDMTITKQSLTKALHNKQRLDQHLYDNLITKTTTSSQETPINELKFHKNQLWSAYMGYKSNSEFPLN